MAYKNKKKNKRHTADLNKDRENWRNVRRREQSKRDTIIGLKSLGLDNDQIEAVMEAKVRRGLFS